MASNLLDLANSFTGLDMIRFYDGNNYYRTILEADPTGLAPRNALNEAFAATGPVVWVWDGPKGNEKRRAKHPDYKMNRPPQTQDLRTSFEFLQELLTHSPAIQVKVPGYEADDVIATLASQYAKAGSDVSIYSNDYDFLQLTAKHPRIFCGGRPKEGVDASDIRLFKATVGDPSDNIKGIKGFGMKSWLAVNKPALRRMITEDGPVPEMLPAPKAWAEQNRDLIKTYWDIVGFYDVPMDVIDQHMTAGKPNFDRADNILLRYHL